MQVWMIPQQAGWRAWRNRFDNNGFNRFNSTCINLFCSARSKRFLNFSSWWLMAIILMHKVMFFRLLKFWQALGCWPTRSWDDPALSVGMAILHLSLLEACISHREDGDTLGMVPLIINPIYTLHSGYLLGIWFSDLMCLGSFSKTRFLINGPNGSSRSSTVFYWRLWKSGWDEPLFLPRVLFALNAPYQDVAFFQLSENSWESRPMSFWKIDPELRLCAGGGSWRLYVSCVAFAPSLLQRCFQKSAGAGGQDQLATSAICWSQWSWDKTCFYQFQGGVRNWGVADSCGWNVKVTTMEWDDATAQWLGRFLKLEYTTKWMFPPFPLWCNKKMK